MNLHKLYLYQTANWLTKWCWSKFPSTWTYPPKIPGSDRINIITPLLDIQIFKDGKKKIPTINSQQLFNLNLIKMLKLDNDDFLHQGHKFTTTSIFRGEFKYLETTWIFILENKRGYTVWYNYRFQWSILKLRSYCGPTNYIFYPI